MTKDFAPQHPAFVKANDLFYAGKVGQAMDVLEDLMVEALANKDDKLVVWVYSNLSFANSVYGDADQAMRYILAAQQRVRTIDDPQLRELVEVRYISLIAKLGSLTEVCRRIQVHQALDDLNTSPFYPFLFAGILGVAQIELGQWAAGERLLRDTLREPDASTQNPYLHVGLVRAVLGGFLDRMLREKENEATALPTIGADSATDVLIHLDAFKASEAVKGIAFEQAEFERGRLCMAQHHFGEARRLFLTHLDWCVLKKDHYRITLARHALAEVSLFTDNPREALKYLAHPVPDTRGDLHFLQRVRQRKLKAAALRDLDLVTDAFAIYKEAHDLETQWLREQILRSPSSTPSPQSRRPQHMAGDAAGSDLLLLAVEYIRNNLCLPITPQTISQHLGVSVRHLQNLFKKTLGTTPSDYLVALRLAKAHAMIVQEGKQLSIAAAAERCGFRRIATFVRQYKEQYGELPSKTQR